MKHAFSFIFLASFLLFILSCSSKPLKKSEESILEHYQDPAYNQVFNSKVLGSLPDEAKIDEVSVFPKDDATYVLVDYLMDDKIIREAFIQKWSEEKQEFFVVRIECVGSCNSDIKSEGCIEAFNKIENTIYCTCEDDECAMETTYL